MRQEAQISEAVLQAVSVPYERANRYKIGGISPETILADGIRDDYWVPTDEDLLRMDTELFVIEESSCFDRCLSACCGVANLRPLKLHFHINSNTNEVFTVQRPFKCGGCCCCPLEMNLFSSFQGQPEGRFIGRVMEDYDNYFSKCCSQCCACTAYHKIETPIGIGPSGETQFEQRYEIVANVCCCGRVDNCCGASCCKDNMVFDINDMNGDRVATLQKVYASGNGCSACSRCCCMFSNYILEFPPYSTVEERMLLVTAMFQIDYHLFEKKGNE